MDKKRIAQKLLEMRDRDQEMRKSGNWDEKIDKENAEKLREIIKEIGWPTISKVGEEASSAAWLIAQHADHDLEFQIECLEMLKNQNEGEVLKKNIAYLEDRVRVAQGKPQIYGTQFYKNEKGELVPRPIEDEENLEKRWQETNMGWPTFKDYLEFMQNLHKNEKGE